MNIAKSVRAAILKIICERQLQYLKYFVRTFVDISYENASFGILKDCMAALYLVLNYDCILAYEISFFGSEGTSSEC